MALFDGFFNAEPVLDGSGNETGEYDRDYNSGSFTGYFGKIIGSGVCIHNAPDSFLVRLESGAAVVSPGYLFIQGYWLRNSDDYPITITGTAQTAIVAHLNMGSRRIELEARNVSQTYPDSLVLAMVDPVAGTVQDTRHSKDICGIIDTAGELSQKVEWAVNYIDNEIEDKLAQVEADITAKQEELNQEIADQEARLDTKIEEAQQRIDSIVPDPVGTIKFSAAETMGENWLKCNGDFIDKTNYPELVEVLGAYPPPADKFNLISDNEIGAQISNGVIYNGRMWVYSYSSKKLYGVDLSGELPIKTVEVSSNSSSFNNFVAPSTTNPLALSIVPNKIGSGANLFLAQVISEGYGSIHQDLNETFNLANYVIIFTCDFSGSESSITLSQCAKTIINHKADYLDISIKKNCIPYVISKASGASQYFYCAICGYDATEHFTQGMYIRWSESSNANAFTISPKEYKLSDSKPFWKNQRVAFSKKNKDEAVYLETSSSSVTEVLSVPDKTFVRGSVNEYPDVVRGGPGPMTIAGSDYVLSSFSLSGFPATPIKKLERTTIGTIDFSLPSSATVFTDAAAYFWGKGIYLIFVGTGIIFSKTLKNGSFGYLDTASVLGNITNFGYLDYSEDENTLYLVGQGTSNQVKVARLEIGDLFEYATEGAWLPTLSMGGIPGWIKAKEATAP